MRLTIVYTLAVAVLQAQAPLSGEAALNRFKQQLEKLARVTQQIAPKLCAIPLLRVPVDPKVDPKMAIVPRSDVRFTIVQVIPPAPACDEGNVSLKR
uniref:Uncharacterized protein n=1 Tax=Solibacter usitatus (strain Ellin6076) TaxID=234267 RepID=Q01Z21_SOLUE